MYLSSMLAREDFFSLFFTTVRKYYKEVYNIDVKIDFARISDSNLVIKPFLSAATAPRMSSKAKSLFYNEWNVRNSWLKYLAAKAGVAFFTNSGKAFAEYGFHMIPETAVTKDLVILPSNRSIRFFDYDTDTVGCMVKDGFTDKYFQNQMEFRKTHSYPFMLPMIKWGDNWFVEPILNGHALARVTNEAHYRKGMVDALAGICQLVADTISYTDINQYVEGMLVKIGLLLADAEKRKNIRTVLATKRIVEKAVKIVRSVLTYLPTCQSHGDFQSGNIWVDKSGKTWIYDWETVGTRSVWYDSAVLCYSLRRPFGWSVLASEPKPEKLLNCDSKKIYTLSEYSAIKAIVLLEDILFYLEDMLELPEDWGNGIYDAYIQRITQIEDKITEV